MPQMNDSGSDLQVIRKKDRGQKIGIDIRHDNRQFRQVDRTQHTTYVGRLSQIIQREIHRIVYMTQLINITEPDLCRHAVVKTNFTHGAFYLWQR